MLTALFILAVKQQKALKHFHIIELNSQMQEPKGRQQFILNAKYNQINMNPASGK